MIQAGVNAADKLFLRRAGDGWFCHGSFLAWRGCALAFADICFTSRLSPLFLQGSEFCRGATRTGLTSTRLVLEHNGVGSVIGRHHFAGLPTSGKDDDQEKQAASAVLVFLPPSPQSGKVEHSYNNNMNSYVFFLGSNPALSAAELWTKLTREGYIPRLEAARAEFIRLRLDKSLPNDFLKSLGGIDRIARWLGRQSHLWEAKELVEALSPAPERGWPKKFSLGISTLNIGSDYAKKIGFEVKKLLKEKKIKVKFILSQGKTSRLNTAQVIFNGLTSSPGVELTVVKNGDEYFLAKTVQIQDIQAYERRDTRRPVRDARVGMLPPKLAQIMLNLVPEFGGSPPVILDPFCGVGTILQEGYLMGYEMIGSDVSERMVGASRENVVWLQSHQQDSSRFPRRPQRGRLGRKRLARPRRGGDTMPARRFKPLEESAGVSGYLFQHDIRKPLPKDLADKVDAVVTEPDLGEPINTPLPGAELEARWRQSAKLYKEFFINVRPVLKDGGGVVMALPAFRQGPTKNSGFYLFPVSFLDEVKRLGYCWNQLLPYELKQYYAASERGSIIYARPDALVGRELTLWHIKKPGAQHN